MVNASRYFCCADLLTFPGRKVAHTLLTCTGWFQSSRWGDALRILQRNSTDTVWTYVCTCRHGRGCAHVQAWVCIQTGTDVRMHVQLWVWVCACAGLDVNVRMRSHRGKSWWFRTAGNLVPRVQAEMSCCLSSGTKAGTHCCPNSRTSRMNTLLCGTWPLVKLRFSALGTRLSFNGESEKLDSVQQAGANVFRKYPSRREMPSDCVAHCGSLETPT